MKKVLNGLVLSGIIWAADQEGAIGELIQRGNLGEAQTELTHALRQQPGDAGLWNLLGIVRAQKGDVPRAAQAFEKAVQLAPRLTGAWLNLGRLYTLKGEDKGSVEKGIRAYEAVLRISPGNPEAHHQMALLLEWQGRFRESLSHLDRLPAEDREKRSALAVRLADEAALGNTKDALEAVEALLRSPDVEESDVAGILPVIDGRNDTITLRLLEGSRARGIAGGETLPHLAALYERRGDLRSARDVYEEAARSSPASAQALIDLARVAWKQKDYEGTLGYLAHARDLEPGNAGVHFFFGVTCNEMKLPVEAKRSLEKALALEPGNPFYNYAMGAVELQWSDKALALPFLKKFTAMRPEDARGHLALATAYFALYQNKEAQGELTIPAKNPQTRAGAEYLLGRIAEQEEDLETALGHFRKLLELEPKSPEAHAEMASLLLERQDVDGSRRETEAALAIEPDNYLANRTLLKMYQTAGDPRVQQQSERLQKLVERRDERLRLLQRTIEVKPQ